MIGSCDPASAAIVDGYDDVQGVYQCLREVFEFVRHNVLSFVECRDAEKPPLQSVDCRGFFAEVPRHLDRRISSPSFSATVVTDRKTFETSGRSLLVSLHCGHGMPADPQPHPCVPVQGRSGWVSQTHPVSRQALHRSIEGFRPFDWSLLLQSYRVERRGTRISIDLDTFAALARHEPPDDASKGAPGD